MKKIAAILLALVIALSMCEAVVALESKTIYREKGVSAHASWSEETDGVYTHTYLSVTETENGTDISVGIDKYDETTGNYFHMVGSKFTEEDVFDVDKKLTTAILSPVEIDLYGWEDEEWIEETITIQAQWTGVGDFVKDSSKTMFKSGDFMSKYSGQSKFREATATGFIGDYDLGVSDYAELVEFRYAEMWMEK
jgi:hypothetical protein